MSMVKEHEKVAAPSDRTKLRIFDCDVHPVPKQGLTSLADICRSPGRPASPRMYRVEEIDSEVSSRCERAAGLSQPAGNPRLSQRPRKCGARSLRLNDIENATGITGK